MNASVRVGILASGRGSNFRALVAAQAQGKLGAEIACLITDNPQAAALDIARTAGIPVIVVQPGPKRTRLSPEAEAQIVETLRAYGVRLVCLAGFMRIVGGTILEAFPHAVLNVHPSLLPSFPGLDAQAQALQHGVKVSGCTVHFADNIYDHGPIIVQRCVSVRQDDTPDSLAARVFETECEAYPEAIRLFATGRLAVENGLARVAN